MLKVLTQYYEATNDFRVHAAHDQILRLSSRAYSIKFLSKNGPSIAGKTKCSASFGSTTAPVIARF